jgi:hypothetical protein
MRTFMAAIVGLVIIGTAAWAQDKDKSSDKKTHEAAPGKDSEGGAVGSISGKLTGVSPDGTFVTIADKKGTAHKVHIGADTKITADGKPMEGGLKSLKTGSSVTIAWEMDTHGNRVGTHIHVQEVAHD